MLVTLIQLILLFIIIDFIYKYYKKYTLILGFNQDLTYDIYGDIYPLNNYQGRVRH